MPWLRDRTIFLTRHGSWAYGTNIETSDEDFKGVAVPPKEYFLGFTQKFEQAESNEPDLVIYEMRKFMALARDCNPNIIEVLWTDPADHVLVTPLGEELLAHREMFLSKKAKFTFSGYAIAQLKRINTHHRWLLHPPEREPARAMFELPPETLIPADQLVAAQAEVSKQLDRWNEDFGDGLDESAKIHARERVEQYLVEMKISKDEKWQAAARMVGLNENFILQMQREKQYRNARQEWEQYQNWKVTRNVARAALEAKHGFDTKHAAHLVRLLRMCREILETGKVNVRREDREELLAIRNGAWTYERLVAWATEQDAAMNGLYKTSTLRHAPDQKALDALCISIAEKML